MFKANSNWLIVPALLTVLTRLSLGGFETFEESTAREPIGRVVVHSGKVLVTGPDGTRTIGSRGDVFQWETVRAYEGSLAFLIINGRTQRLEPGRNMRTDDWSPPARQESIIRRIGRFIEIALLPQSRPSSPLIHKGDAEENRGRLRILFPKETGVLGFQPMFAWSEGDSVYEVSLFQAEGDQERFWRTKVQHADSLSYPANKRPLRPDHKYLWEVRDRNNPRNLDVATFHLADQATHAEIVNKAEMLRANCQALNLPEDSCTLSLSGLYEELGFRYEAIQVLLHARKRGVGESTLAPALHRMLSGK